MNLLFDQNVSHLTADEIEGVLRDRYDDVIACGEDARETFLVLGR